MAAPKIVGGRNGQDRVDGCAGLLLSSLFAFGEEEEEGSCSTGKFASASAAAAAVE